MRQPSIEESFGRSSNSPSPAPQSVSPAKRVKAKRPREDMVGELEQIRLTSESGDQELARMMLAVVEKKAARRESTPTYVAPVNVVDVDQLVAAARTTPTDRCREHYTYKEKTKHIRGLAAASSAAAYSTETGIAESTLKRWRLHSAEIMSSVAQGHGNRSRRETETTKYCMLYKFLYTKYLALRELLLVVNYQVLHSWACCFSPDFASRTSNSQREVLATFRRKYNLVRRRRTGTAQILPQDLGQRIVGFNALLRGAAARHQISIVVCADETFVLQESTGAHTYARKGERSVPVRTFNDKRGCTVHLGAKAVRLSDDTWAVVPLRPMVIFKGGKIIEGEITKGSMKATPNDPRRFVQCYQPTVSENGWMTSELFITWLTRLPVPPSGTKGLLVVDIYAAHRTIEVLKKIDEINYVVVFIPGGCTSKLQVHDVFINKTFKADIQNWHALQRAKQGSADPVSRVEVARAVASCCESVKMVELLYKGMHRLILEPMREVALPNDCELQEEADMIDACDDAAQRRIPKGFVDEKDLIDADDDDDVVVVDDEYDSDAFETVEDDVEHEIGSDSDA